MDVSWYHYHLPENAIAKAPASPRDSAKLLVYDTTSDRLFFDKVLHLDCYLPKKSLLVMNETKVIPARLEMQKQSRGKVRILFFLNEPLQGSVIRGYSDRRLKKGDVLNAGSHIVEVCGQEGPIFSFKLCFSINTLLQLLDRYGTMPIPPYIKDSPLSERGLRKKYQTIFASKSGSIAAPTAGLHFTSRLLKKLKQKEFEQHYLSHRVGHGTFAPLTEQHLASGKLHSEWYICEKCTWDALAAAKKEGKKIAAIGTTTMRALESIARSHKLSASTSLFIRPPFEFQMVDILLSNFHLPGSSLMMLVEAFLQYKKARKNVKDLYQIAIQKKFRFYSFGDAILLR